MEQKNNIQDRLNTLTQMKQMAHEANGYLKAGELDAIGQLLDEAWFLKKQLASGISNGTIDELYQTARQAGAIGGKITGAGGGGFLLLYCPCERQEAVRQALSSLRELPFNLELDGSKVIFHYRR